MPGKEFDDVIQLIDSLPDRKGLTLQERRSEFEKAVSLLPVAEGVSFEPLKVGSMPAEWVFPQGAPEDRAILYLHGGGYCEGSINTHRGLVSFISKATGVRVLLLDYRLAPEDPFPAAVEDSTAAYQWLLSEGIEPHRIVVAGDSAGGGLTVATLVALKEKGSPIPAAAVCISPWVDLEVTGESVITKAKKDPIVQREVLIEMAKAYINGEDPRTPLASPIYADLHGLPPLLIHVGTSEILLDDSIRLADRARKAGVEVTLEPWEEMIHVWHFFPSMLPEARETIEVAARYIKGHIR